MKTVLIIDDDEAILSTFALALKYHGHHVITAGSGDEGIELARRHLPDLVISDINMPGTDGRSVLRALRTDPQLVSTQIVLMTGNTAAVTPRTGMNLGADDFLVKPISLEDLLRCVDVRLRRADLNWRVEDRMLLDLRSTMSTTFPHELFTPLAGILGLTEILRSEFTQMRPEEVTDMLADIRKSGERLHRTLRNYLLLLEIQAEPGLPPKSATIQPEIMRTEIAHRINETLDRHGRRTDGAIELAPVSLSGDLSDMKIIVEELVDNACRYSRKGTWIGVRLQDDGAFSVLDGGRGLSSEQIEQIGAFHQFDRKKHEQQGLGLGLTLVKKLVARNGVGFAVTSEEGRGSKSTVTFRVAAPLAAP